MDAKGLIGGLAAAGMAALIFYYYLLSWLLSPFAFIYATVVKPSLFFVGWWIPTKPPPPPSPEPSSYVSTYLYCPNPIIEDAFFAIEIAKRPAITLSEEWNEPPKKGRLTFDKNCKWNGIFSNDNNCQWRKNLYQYSNDFYQYSENFDQLALNHAKVFVASEDPTIKLRQIESQSQLLDSGSVKIGFLGIYASDYSVGAAKRGALIDEVYVGSAAEDAGFKPGDIIVEVNHYVIENVKDFYHATLFRQAGEELKIKIITNQARYPSEAVTQSVKLREQEIVCIENDDCFDYYLDLTQEWLDFHNSGGYGGLSPISGSGSKLAPFPRRTDPDKFIYESYYEVGQFGSGGRLMRGLRYMSTVGHIPGEDALYLSMLGGRGMSSNTDFCLDRTSLELRVDEDCIQRTHTSTYRSTKPSYQCQLVDSSDQFEDKTVKKIGRYNEAKESLQKSIWKKEREMVEAKLEDRKF